MAPAPKLPYNELIFILVGLGITILLLVAISNLLSVGCGKTRGLIAEGFADGDYSDKLEKRLQTLDKGIEQNNDLLDSFSENLGVFKTDICDITTQIDESLQSNYESRFTEIQKKLSATEKNELKTKYISDLKSDFEKLHSDEKILECFENANDGLISHIDETADAIAKLKDKFANVQKVVSDKQIGVYYISLAYNDKYIKQSTKVANSLNEGFAEEVIDFSNMPKRAKSEKGVATGNAEGAEAAEAAPITQIEKLEEDCETLSKKISQLAKKVRVIKNTIDLQKKTLDQSMAITKDEELQKAQAAKNFEQQRTKTS